MGLQNASVRVTFNATMYDSYGDQPMTYSLSASPTTVIADDAAAVVAAIRDTADASHSAVTLNLANILLSAINLPFGPPTDLNTVSSLIVHNASTTTGLVVTLAGLAGGLGTFTLPPGGQWSIVGTAVLNTSTNATITLAPANGGDASVAYELFVVGKT